MTVMYFVGGGNMSIAEPLRLAADGMYHVVRFTRYGANATLQLDDLPTQTRNYSGQYAYVSFGNDENVRLENGAQKNSGLENARKTTM